MRKRLQITQPRHDFMWKRIINIKAKIKRKQVDLYAFHKENRSHYQSRYEVHN